MGARVGGRVPSTVAVAGGFAVSAIIYVVAVPPAIPDVDLVVWGQLVWIAVIGTAVAFLVEMMALERDDPGRIGVAATLEPVVAAGGAWLALGQSLTPIQVLGGGLVVAGIAVVQHTTSAIGSEMPDLAV